MTAPHLTRTFKPRRRALSPERQTWLAAGLERWGLAEEGPLLDLAAEFARVAPVVLDVGFGDGMATTELADRFPDHDVIAVDVHTPGVAYVLSAIEDGGLSNVRIVPGDALVLLDRLPERSLAEVRVWFPDPWPKVRHHRRRLVQSGTVGQIVDRMAIGATLHLATDSESYAQQMVAVCGAEPRVIGGVVPRPSWRPVTRYEWRALLTGRAATDLVYRRVR